MPIYKFPEGFRSSVKAVKTVARKAMIEHELM